MFKIPELGLFNAHAITVDNKDSHLKKGNYVRISPHPKLGLPVAPIFIGRIDMSLKVINNIINDTALFIDSDGEILQPPFHVTPDNPVTAKILMASSQSCGWAEVNVRLKEVARNTNPVLRDHIAVLNARVRNRIIYDNTTVIANRNRYEPINTVILNEVELLERFNRTFYDFNNARLNPVLQTNIKCEAFVNSASGPVSVGQRSSHRYCFTAPSIVEIKISGTGEVGGIRWIDTKTLISHSRVKAAMNDIDAYEVLNLPHPGGMRYLSVKNAVDRAYREVKKQAPKRFPLQETTYAPKPNAVKVSTASDEVNRVRSLYADMDKDLESLINDPISPHKQMIRENIKDDKGAIIGTSDQLRLHYFSQLQIDPGTASLIGYKLYDEEPIAANHIAIYWVSAVYDKLPWSSSNDNNEDVENHVVFNTLIQSTLKDNKPLSKDFLLNWLKQHANKASDKTIRINEDMYKRFNPRNNFIGLSTIAIADPDSILDPVEPPTIDRITHKEWLPTSPPEAKRYVKVDLSDTIHAGLLAAGKKHFNQTSNYHSLNKQNRDRYHFPILLDDSVDKSQSTTNLTSAMKPNSGFISDRQAPPQRVQYFIAQQDRFGRWSDWAKGYCRPAPRPKPPQPYVQAFYKQPSIHDAATIGGDILIKVPVPDLESLAPASLPLKQLYIVIQDMTLGNNSQGNQTHQVLESQKVLLPQASNSSSAVDNYYIMFNTTGPILQPTEEREISIIARWHNVSNQHSIYSEPVTLALTDPRPPPQLPLPNIIQFAARPDIMGTSWIEYRWQPLDSKVKYDIYYTDENRLLAHLESIGKTLLLNSIKQSDLAAKAQIFKNNRGLFPDYLFEKLNDVIKVSNSGARSFRHGVSGSLALLNFYKIAVVSATGAKPNLLDLDMIVFAIPNADPPAIPSLMVKQAEPLPNEASLIAQISIEVQPSPVKAVRYRLRRTSISSAEIMQMPIVTVSDFIETHDMDGVTTATYRDDGSVIIAQNYQLKPWVQYTWVAEVQGPPQGGNTPNAIDGSWSQASDPYGLTLIPDQPPAAATITSFISDRSQTGHKNIRLTLTHPDDLSGGMMGSYIIGLKRRLSSTDPFKFLGDIKVSGMGPFTIEDDLDDLVNNSTPSGTEYQVQVTDPIGRTSDMSNIYKVV